MSLQRSDFQHRLSQRSVEGPLTLCIANAPKNVNPRTHHSVDKLGRHDTVSSRALKYQEEIFLIVRRYTVPRDVWPDIEP